MKKEVELIPYVSVYKSGRTMSFMPNPLDKPFNDFVFADDVIACHFSYVCGKENHLGGHASAPYLFIGTPEDALKYSSKTITKDGKRYVFMDNVAFEMIDGAKFAPKEKALIANEKGGKISNTRTIDFASNKISMFGKRKEKDTRSLSGFNENIGTRGNLPDEVKIGDNVAEIQFVEEFVGTINIPAKHLDPKSPDLESVIQTGVSFHTDLSPLYHIGRIIPPKESMEMFPYFKLTQEMGEETHYMMPNGNIRELPNDQNPNHVVAPDEINALYRQAIAPKTKARKRTAKFDKGLAKQKKLTTIESTKGGIFAEEIIKR